MNTVKMDTVLLCLCILIPKTFALNLYDGNGQNLSDIPSDIPTEVTTVRLSNNRIRNISSDAFENLSHVKAIFINHNSLESFPNLTTVAGTLDKLELTHNLITFVEGNLLNSLEKLTILELSHNPIQTLPVISSKLSLMRLRVENMELSEPPVMENK